MDIKMDQRTYDIIEKALTTAEMAIVAKSKFTDLLLGTILVCVLIVSVAAGLIYTW